MAQNWTRSAFLAAIAGVFAAGLLVSAAPAAAADAASPRGHFDEVSARSGYLELSGWAADPDAPGASLTIELYHDILRPDGRREHWYVHRTSTGTPRPDVAAAVPYAGANAGWTHKLNLLRFAPGEVYSDERICAYAINVGAGHNVGLGCKGVPQTARHPHDPRGHLDVLEVSPGQLIVRGWAADPDAASDTMVEIHDQTSATARPDDRLLFRARANASRPDVSRVFPQFDGTTGFSATIPMRASRPYGTPTVVPELICAYAVNQGSGHHNTTLGCGSVVVPPPPARAAGGANAGLLESCEQDRGSNHFCLDGWASDPESSEPPTVRLRLVTHHTPSDHFGDRLESQTVDIVAEASGPPPQHQPEGEPREHTFRLVTDFPEGHSRSFSTGGAFCLYVTPQGRAEILVRCDGFD